MTFGFPASRATRHAALPLLLVPFGLVLGGAWVWPIACLMAVLAATEDDTRALLIWYGVALGCDPQALLLAPFVLALAIQRRTSPMLLACAALVAAAILLARAFGGDAPAFPFPLDLPLSRGAPNLWVLAQALPGIGALPLTGLALAATVGAGAAYAAWFSVRKLYRHTVPDAALLCALVMAAVLPGADIAVLAVVDLLALMLAMGTRRDPARWRVAGLALGGSTIALFATPDAAPLAAAVLVVATLLQARAVLKPAANDNPLMARTA
ncbi:hypothetical protein [Sphingomonas psychrolutea]|uniref:DUF2029 domain-containing protein n=1 Tax=Sphingomonas psychrolutea TaxID=1259676 RepID=A0ABQ1H0Z9_9SPHN|nr:hypothetical protein [Sphingomonas psychrolutea]GGA54916.1 hypothetical protein GCM10011395_26660 [Sphingomonas psychrolutea]